MVSAFTFGYFARHSARDVAVMHQPDTTSSERIAWIDAARGIGITLVVFAHVLGGGNARGWFGDGVAARAIYDYIYLFHMPLFFFISGVVGIDSMRSRPLATIGSRVRGIAWPYLLWGLIGVLMLPLISRFMLAAPSADISSGLWRLFTGETSWFLWTLFMLEMLILPAARAPLPLLLASSFLVYAISAKYGVFGYFTMVARNAPFFVLGCLCSRSVRELRFATGWHESVGLMTLGLLLFAGLALIMSATGSSESLYLLGGVVGSAATIAWTLAIRSKFAQRTLQSLGLASLSIFLLHPYFQGATRELTVTFGHMDLYFAFPLIGLAALGGPWLTWALSQKYGFTWLFRLPQYRKPTLA